MTALEIQVIKPQGNTVLILPALPRITRYRKSFLCRNRCLLVDSGTTVYNLRSAGDAHTIPEGLQKITLESPLAACPKVCVFVCVCV